MLKIGKMGLLIVGSILLCLSGAMAQNSANQDKASNARSSSHVFLLSSTLTLTKNGVEAPTIDQLILQPGRMNPKRLLNKVDSQTTWQAQLVNHDGRVIFQMGFDFPKLLMVPMPLERRSENSGSDVLAIEEPEVALVLPYFPDAASVRIRNSQKNHIGASLSVEKAVRADIPMGDGISAPPPSEPGTFHVLIMASGYTAGNMSAFDNRAQEVKNTLLGMEPFQSFKTDIETHIYNNTENLGCYSGCSGIDRLMCCNSTSVMSAAAASGAYYDEIIVVHNTATYSGGGYRDFGSYQTNSYDSYSMIYDGSYSAVMSMHEFGHSFGNLCDEYSYGSEGYSYQDCVNCRSNCSSWTGACNLGCDAKPNYYRPDDSIMLTLGYNTFNSASIENGLIPRLQYFTQTISDNNFLDWPK